ncbi:MAG: putative lipid II flippase FtsW [Acutalibacteraceae bacterium]|jgi:cell division protein FtsW
MTANQTARAPRTRSTRRQGLFFTKGGMDMPFFVILLAVLAVGLICLYSASYAYAYSQNDGDSYFYISKQLLFALGGIVAMVAVSYVNYQIWHRLAIPLMGIAVILLVVVLLLPAQNGIHRWIRMPGIQFQPSEIAKFALILLFAHLISLNHKRMNTFKNGFVPFLLILGVVCFLVFEEPHLSGTMLLLSIGLVMMYVGGTRRIYLAGIILLGAAAVFLMVGVMGYEQDRIAVWRDPLGVFEVDRDQAWQTVQSLYAIGSGGLMGQGLGNSRQKHLFLPEPQNDFIFSVICEELGLIGAVLVIALFGLLVWRGFVIGMRAKDKFGSMLAIGLTAQVGIQVLLNIAVVTNTIPNTGISLPFFSYGGTSLMMLLAQMGIVLSISRQSHVKEE